MRGSPSTSLGSGLVPLRRLVGASRVVRWDVPPLVDPYEAVRLVERLGGVKLAIRSIWEECRVELVGEVPGEVSYGV